MKPQNIFLFTILLATFFVRFYRFDSPIADWHSWRQADTSAVSRNFVAHGYDILHPRFDDISNVASGMDNPHGYRFVEFPIYNLLQAGMYQAFGIFTLEEWGRLVTIIASTLATLLIFLIVKRHANQRVALVSALVLGLAPYSIYYGRVILPDTSMMAATLAGIYFFDRWIEKKQESGSKNQELLSFILSIVFTAVALLLKPFAAFFFLPLVILAYNKWGFGLLKKWQLWIFAFCSVLPLIAWRMWMQQFPEGIPVSQWLFNGNGIRFRPSFFRWILYERVTRLISGYAAAVLLIPGLLQTYKTNERLFFFSFIASSSLYVLIIATGNVQHDYYQIPLMPTIALFMAFGAEFVIRKIKRVALGYAIVGAVFVVSFLLAWDMVKDYFNINNRSIVVAGEAVRRLTPKDAKIIAPYDGDTSLLYQTNRKGWPSFEHSAQELVEMGASYLLIVNPKPYDVAIGKTYKVIESTQDYILFDLKNK